MSNVNQIYKHAITRTPPSSMANGITTQSVKINMDLALQQHEAYIAILKNLGVVVTVLEPEERFPDSHFVEDAAIIHNHIAILTRPGAAARKGEVACLRLMLQGILEVRDLGGDEHATVDGGDVLFMGNNVFIGISHRTNQAGASALAAILTEIDPELSVHTIPLSGVLHLKTGLTALGPDLLLGNPEMKLHSSLPAGKIIWLPHNEAHAANTLVVNGTAVVAADCPVAFAAARDAGLTPIELDMSEFRKMDGSFTCLSLLW